MPAGGELISRRGFGKHYRTRKADATMLHERPQPGEMMGLPNPKCIIGRSEIAAQFRRSSAVIRIAGNQQRAGRQRAGQITDEIEMQG